MSKHQSVQWSGEEFLVKTIAVLVFTQQNLMIFNHWVQESSPHIHAEGVRTCSFTHACVSTRFSKSLRQDVRLQQAASVCFCEHNCVRVSYITLSACLTKAVRPTGKKCLRFVGVPSEVVSFQCGFCRHINVAGCMRKTAADVSDISLSGVLVSCEDI